MPRRKNGEKIREFGFNSSMENDQRLTPLPVIKDIQSTHHIDYPTGGYAASYEDTLDNKRTLRQYFNVVYKRLPIILAITILVTAAASFYMYRQPSQYETSTRIIIEPRKAAQAKKDSVTINLGDDEKYYRTQLELLKSPDLMKRVVISLGLHRDPNLFDGQNRGIMSGLRSLFSGGPKETETPNTLPVISDASIDPEKKGTIELSPEESTRAERYAGMFGVQVIPLNQTNIVTVSVTSSNAAVAPKVADKIAELFIAEDRQRETYGAEQAYKELGTSIEDLKANIIQQENIFIAEMKASDLPLVDKGGELRAGNLEGLLTQWREAQNQTGLIEAQYRAARNAIGTGDILSVIPDNVAIQNIRMDNLKRRAEHQKRIDEITQKIDEAEEKRKGLLAKYTDKYKDVIAISEQIKELNEQKARIEGEVTKKIKEEGEKLERDAEREALASLSSQLTAAQQREARQRAAFEQAASKANFEGITETKITGLKRELETSRSLLDNYIQRQKEQELALSSDRPNNIKQQGNAGPAGLIGPKRGQNILIAMLLSFAAGIGLAFLLDFLDDSVRTSDDISRHLGLPTLALIPHHLGNEKRKLLPGGNGPGNIGPTALIAMEERTSPIAEAYRHLRTSLLFSSAGKPPQTILITSSQPSEGKTTTAINTAITLAQSDVDVVIIDCDLRRPRLHSHFGLENTRGLTNYLSGDKETEGLIRTYADLPRLKIITSGPIPPNPAELLSSNEMRNLLQFLSGKFKHVIIDSPPAISFTDASILSTLVDGVVLVAMANKSSIHLMRQFKQRVSAIGARIYGVVLNGIKANSAEYYYYGSGYYNYYSRPVDDESTPFLEDQAKSDEQETKL